MPPAIMPETGGPHHRDARVRCEELGAAPYRITNGLAIGSGEVLIHTVFGRV